MRARCRVRSTNTCEDLTKCPTEAKVLATAPELRYERWEAPMVDGKCSTGCSFSYCGTTWHMPCCLKEDSSISTQCPSRARVMLTREEKRCARSATQCHVAALSPLERLTHSATWQPSPH